MIASATQTELLRKLSELRFCIAELQRRQQTDRWRAWLWQLKENAARQMLAMLQQSIAKIEVGYELTVDERTELMARHPLLLDPRDSRTTIAPRWRTELQANVRQTLERFLAETQFNQARIPAA